MQKYNLPGPKSKALIERTLLYIGKAQYAGLYGICIDKGKGSIIEDVDSNQYIDLLASGSVANLGYNNQKLIKAMTEQAEKIQHTMFIYSPNEVAAKYAKAITETFPKRENGEKIKVMFGTSGSDANDGAIKCARRFTGRKKIISFINGWHGSTGLSHQANGFAGVKEGLFFPENEFVQVPFPYNQETAQQAIDIIKKELAGGDVAGIIVECVQGDGGNKMPYPGALEEIANLVQEKSALFIVDEIQSGNGRSGKHWEIEHFNIKPDIITSAKGITGGYFPLSICMGREEIIESLGKVQFVFTYTANPIGCAVALQTLQIINNEKFLEQVNDISKIYKDGLTSLVRQYEIVKEVRGLGLHLGMEVRDGANPYGGLLGFLCAQRGVYPGYFGANNEVLRIHPPLIISVEEAKKSIEIIAECLDIIQYGEVDSNTLANYRKYAIGLGNNGDAERISSMFFKPNPPPLFVL